ncbi:unnamed protein product [Rhizoctonia solani]|uniref:Uncharacterized protein n=1 Tax=Rhizoctonia solani TaxID=456999 RepID=A0A8H3A9Y2_9AGAM|nr:unnamed protein product [Rhizoctonia solani]
MKSSNSFEHALMDTTLNQRVVSNEMIRGEDRQLEESRVGIKVSFDCEDQRVLSSQPILNDFWEAPMPDPLED